MATNLNHCCEKNPDPATAAGERGRKGLEISQQSVGRLQNLPLFGGINSATIEMILGLSSLVRKKKGEYFFREGEAGASAFVMQKGSASIIKSFEQSEYLIRHISEGDCFGEMAIIDCLPRSASVKADVDADAIEITASALLDVYQRDLEQFTLIQMNMAREVSRRLREVSDRLSAYRLGRNPDLNS